MRIDKLYIKAFKNLRDFSIDFNEKSWVTVLLGWNGTGKSNIIEALVVIFRDLDLGSAPSFPFRIAYECRKHKVVVEAKGGEKKDVFVEIDGSSISYAKFASDDGLEYRPAHVFGYYSGPSNRLEEHFKQHQEHFYRDLLANKPRPLRRLFYARPVHSQFVLLSFFRAEEKRRQRFIKDLLGIASIDSVLFVMRQPPWFQKKPSEQVRKEGDKRFWFARGTVRMFLDKLFNISLAPMRLHRRIPVEFQKTKTLEHLYLYVRNNADLAKLAKSFGTQTDFFKTLESTYISKLLAEVRVRVRVRGVDGALTFRELSEGEQQLITVLGLLEFTKEEESLFLLDEPDTHLNPAWSMQYLELLREVIQDNDRSHIIMVTHDPLAICELVRDQVQILVRKLDSPSIKAFAPDEDPKGLGVAGILTSDMFGLLSTLDRKTLADLDEKRHLSVESQLGPDDQQRLDELNKSLGRVDFGAVMRDPLYSRFVKAIYATDAAELLRQPVLTTADRQMLQGKANDVMRALKEGLSSNR